MENASHVMHQEKSIELTHSEIRLAVTETFKSLNIVSDTQKEIYLPLIFELLIKFKLNHFEIVKILNNHV